MKSICTQLIDIIKKNLINIKKLKNTFYKKNDGSHVSEGDLLIQKLLQDEISTNYNKYFLISERLFFIISISLVQMDFTNRLNL